MLALLFVISSPLPAAAAETAEVISAGSPSIGAVALTFDDGWSRTACASIGRTLRAHGVTGTFFINGNRLLKAPARWRRILRRQQVANHAREHHDLVKRSNRFVRRQIRKNEAIHERILGRPMLKLFRPPYGSHDERIRGIAGRLGYRHTVLWNVNSGDSLRSSTRETVIRRSTGAEPGSIILLHCKDNATPEALPAIIRHYQDRGIKLVGLQELLAP